jgi:hypothetical protein
VEKDLENKINMSPTLTSTKEVISYLDNLWK